MTSLRTNTEDSEDDSITPGTRHSNSRRASLGDEDSDSMEDKSPTTRKRVRTPTDVTYPVAHHILISISDYMDLLVTSVTGYVS